MSRERKPPTPDVPPRDDFVWPPTTDELDSIEVIMLQPRSDDGPKTDAMRQTAATTTDGVSRTDIRAQAPASLDAQTIDRVPRGPSRDTRRPRVWAPRLRSLDRRLREFRIPHLRVPRMRVRQVHAPRMCVPRIAMPRVSVSRVSVPGASGFIAAVMVARSSRLGPPNGADVAHWGLALTSLLAIVVALVLQVSQWGRTPEAADRAATIERAALTTAATSTRTPTQEPLAPLSHAVAATTKSRTDALVPFAMAAQAPSIAAHHSSSDPRNPGERVPARASTFGTRPSEIAAALATASPTTAAHTLPEDVRDAESAFATGASRTAMAPGVRVAFAAASSTRLTRASPTTSETPMAGVARSARAAMGRTTPAMRLRERIDRDDTPWWGRRTRAASSSRPSYSRRAATMSAGVVSPPLRLPESYVQPRLVSSGDRGRVRGKVVLGVQVRSNGRVGEVNVLSGDVDRDLERAAVAAVKQWRYRPALRDGVPTAARVKVVVNFG